MQLQALLEDETFEITIDGDETTVDGERVDLRVRKLSEHTLHVLIDGRSFVVTAVRVDDRTVRVTHEGRTREVRLKSERDLLLEKLGMGTEVDIAPTELKAPMPGLVLQVLVEDGQTVEAGAGLVVLEAMKMENELRAEIAGRVARVHIEPGAAVTKGELLISFEKVDG